MTKKLKLISGVLFFALMSANIGANFYPPAPPLGFLRQVNVRPVETWLGPGDALIWLSDGFEERMNHADQIWGSEEVRRALERICGEETSAENIARRMIEACDGAAGGRGNEDDMTIVVARVRLI